MTDIPSPQVSENEILGGTGHSESSSHLPRFQEALFTVLNDEYDLALDDFQKLWPSLEALLAGFGLTSTPIESYPEVS